MDRLEAFELMLSDIKKQALFLSEVKEIEIFVERIRRYRDGSERKKSCSV